MFDPRSTDLAARRLELTQLRRDTRSALELAIVDLAPIELIQGLASAAGLLEALLELPHDSVAGLALGPPTVESGRRVLSAWSEWFTTRDQRARR